MASTDTDRRVQCGNCEWEGKESEIIPLEEVAHLNERLDAGSEVPAGECKECGALCYLADTGKRDA